MDKRESEQLSQNNSDCRYLAEQSSRGDHTAHPLYDLLSQGFWSQAPQLHAAQSYDIHREIQKEHIRVQMLEEEIAKKRVLEAEVRRELLILEAELSRSRVTTGMLLRLPKHPRYATMGKAVLYEGVGAHRVGLDVTNADRASETSPFQRGTHHGFSSSSAANELRHLDTILEDVEALCPERTGRQNGFERESNLLPEVSQPKDTERAPFTMGLGTLRVQEVIPENGNKKKRIILMPNPEHSNDEIKSGSKRKADSDTPPQDEIKSDALPDEEESNSKVLLEQKMTAEMRRRKGNSMFWCDLCQIGTPTQKSMDVHILGKKHVKLLAKSGMADDLKKKKKIEAAPVDCVKQISDNGNSTTPETVDMVSEKAGLGQHEPPIDSNVEKDVKDAELTEQEPVREAKTKGVMQPNLWMMLDTCDAVMTEAGKTNA